MLPRNGDQLRRAPRMPSSSGGTPDWISRNVPHNDAPGIACQSVPLTGIIAGRRAWYASHSDPTCLRDALQRRTSRWASEIGGEQQGPLPHGSPSDVVCASSATAHLRARSHLPAAKAIPTSAASAECRRARLGGAPVERDPCRAGQASDVLLVRGRSSTQPAATRRGTMKGFASSSDCYSTAGGPSLSARAWIRRDRRYAGFGG